MHDLKLRTPVDAWVGGSLNWCTLFNDLRSDKSFGERSRKEVLLEELKHQALFSDSFVIRDADVVNSPELLEIVNQNIDGVQQLIREGILVFAIRTGAGSFTKVNEDAKRRRATPNHYLGLREGIATLDNSLQSVRIAVVEHGLKTDTFSENLEKILASRLTDRQHRVLEQAISKATGKRKGQNLRFGDIYTELVRNEKIIWPKAEFKDRTRLVELCRAAHVLTTPMICGLTPITADKDILPQDVALITGFDSRASLGSQEVDLLDWFDRFPKMVFGPGFIERLKFADIIRYRSRLEGVAYFKSMEATRRASDEDTRYESFLSYLKALEAYLISTAVDAKAELLPWQLFFAQSAIKKMQDEENRSVKATVTSVPVAIGVMASGLWQLVMQTPFPAVIAAGIAKSCSPLLDFALSQTLERDSTRDPLPLTRLIAGATRTPLAS